MDIYLLRCAIQDIPVFFNKNHRSITFQFYVIMVAEKEDSLVQQVQLHLAGEKEKREVKLKNKNLK